MGKRSKRRSRQCYEDLINDDGIFEKIEESGGVPIERTFIQLSFLMIYTMLLYYMPFMTDCGNKGEEFKRDRRPFEEKVERKLSKYLFRRVYRMTNASFHKLHAMLEPQPHNSLLL